MKVNVEQIRPFLTPGAIILAGLIVAVAIVLPSWKSGMSDDLTSLVPPVQASDHVTGSDDARITVVEYMDYRCPYCAKFHETMEKVMANTDHVRYVLRDFAIYGDGPAIASECIAKLAGNEAFFKFAGALFQHQEEIKRSYLEKLAVGYGITEDAFTQCFLSNDVAKEVRQEGTEAKRAGARGTPFNVVINEKTGEMTPFSGALPYARVMSIIKGMQAKAS